MCVSILQSWAALRWCAEQARPLCSVGVGRAPSVCHAHISSHTTGQLLLGLGSGGRGRGLEPPTRRAAAALVVETGAHTDDNVSAGMHCSNKRGLLEESKISYTPPQPSAHMHRTCACPWSSATMRTMLAFLPVAATVTPSRASSTAATTKPIMKES